MGECCRDANCLPRRRCGDERCDLAWCDGTRGIGAVFAAPRSTADAIYVDAVEADCDVDADVDATIAVAVVREIPGPSIRDGGDDEGDVPMIRSLENSDESNNATTTTSSSSSSPRWGGLHGVHTNNTVDVPLAGDSSSSAHSASVDVVTLPLFSETYDVEEDLDSPSPGNDVAVDSADDIYYRCGDDGTLTFGRLGIAPMINDDDDDATAHRGGNDASGGSDDRTSYNDDGPLDGLERHCITLTQIFKESRGAIHPPSVSSITTVENEMPTKKEKDSPPPLHRADVSVANAFVSPPTTTIATLGCCNSALMSRAKLRRRMRSKAKMANF